MKRNKTAKTAGVVILILLAVILECLWANLSFFFCVLPNRGSPTADKTTTVSNESFVLSANANTLGIMSVGTDIYSLEIMSREKQSEGRIKVSVYETDKDFEADGKRYTSATLSTGKSEAKATRLYFNEDSDYIKLVFELEGSVTVDEITINPAYRMRFNLLRFALLAAVLVGGFLLLIKEKTIDTLYAIIKNEKVKRAVLDITLPALILLLSLLTVCYYILFPAEGYLHSDCTDTILWAEASYQSGKLISDNFGYAAILPFAGNLLMLVFRPFFGYSMTTHNLGMLLFVLLLFAAAIFFCRSLKMSNLKTSAFVFVLFFVLSSSDKLREIMWGHIIYYSLGILFFLVGFGILFRITDRYANNSLQNLKLSQIVLEICGGVRGLILNTVLLVFCMLTATNGTQSLLTFILPLLGAIVLERVTDNEKNFVRSSLSSGVTLAFAGFGTLLGLLLGKAIIGEVGSGYATAYSSYDNFADWVDNLLIFPQHYFELLGVQAKLYDPIVSLDSIFTMIKVFGGLLLLILPVIYLIRASRTNNRNGKLLVYGHFVLCALLMYAYICGLLSTANWRLVPLLASSVTVSVVAVFDLLADKTLPSLKRIGALMLALILLLSAIPCAQIMKMPSDYGRDNSLHTLTEGLQRLDEEGILPEVGYATFWNSQAVTLLSDNEIKLRNVNVDGKPTKYDYQQFFSWYDGENFSDGCYLVLTAAEISQMRSWLTASNYTRREQVGVYTVYVYDYNILE